MGFRFNHAVNGRYAVLCAFALMMAACVEAQAAVPTPAVPSSSPGAWVTSNDYPTLALRDNVEGVVRFLLTIGSDGVPTKCEIMQSSGSAMLDSQTCTLLQLRARFRPASNARGKPTEGTYSSSVNWRIPITLPHREAGVLEFSYLVDTEGTIGECKIIRAEGKAAAMTTENLGFCNGERDFTPYLDETGKPVARRVISRTSIAIEAP